MLRNHVWGFLFLVFMAKGAISADADYNAVWGSYGYDRPPPGYCYNNLSYGGRCSDLFPGTAPYFWRYVEHVGFRKFTPIGGLYQDWFDYRTYRRHEQRRERRRRGGGQFTPSFDSIPVF